MKRKLPIIALAIIAIAALWALLPDYSALEHRAPGGRAAGSTVDQAADPVLARSIVDEPPGRPTGLEILVEAAESGARLADAIVQPLPAAEDHGVLASELAVLARSTTAGVAVVPLEPSAPPSLLVSAPGRVPAVVTIDGDVLDRGSALVVLRVASRVEVLVVRQDAFPVDDCTVILSARNFGLSDSLPPHGIGHPTADNATWVDQTDATGKVSFDPVPDGRFWITCRHPHWMPAAQDQYNRLVDVAGTTAVTIHMNDAYGVVFACPPDVEAERIYWEISWRAIEIGSHARNGVEPCRRALMERFPDGFVQLARPLDVEQEHMIGCRVVTSDNRVFGGKWPLYPIRQIEAPVYLEEVLGGDFRELELRFVDDSGRALPLPGTLYNRDTNFTIQCSPGERVLVPHGEYGVQIPRGGRIADASQLRERTLEIDADQPLGDILEVRVTGTYGIATLQPRFPGEPLTFLHIFVTPPGLERPTEVIANWHPSQGPLMVSTEPGKVRLLIKSAAYESVELDVDLSDPAAWKDVAFELKLRQ